MHIHILGIGGTFMAGLALLARALGHTVTGCDRALYPPMSTQLEQAGIVVHEGHQPSHLKPTPDFVVIGNVMTRGNPAVEQVLNSGLAYASGPEWLARQVLARYHVLAVAGTHGKTTTTSMLAWILECAGLQPGFLVGGVPENFGVSARLGSGKYFVVEADEYDTAFFDKRAKFIHYRPRTLILNNLEFDHADIYPDLAAIQRQFHHLLRTVPGAGLVVANGADAALAEVLGMGCWTPVEYFGSDSTNAAWRSEALGTDARRFAVYHHDRCIGEVSWALMGHHNMMNATAAIAAAHHAGVPTARAVQALASFRNVKRRLQVLAQGRGVTLYDDFAHHPTAIAATLSALRAHVGAARIIAVFEPRSNTFKMGVHKDRLASALTAADRVLLFDPADLPWSLSEVTAALPGRASCYNSIEKLYQAILAEAQSGDHVLIMSNGGFGGLATRLAQGFADAA